MIAFSNTCHVYSLDATKKLNVAFFANVPVKDLFIYLLITLKSCEIRDLSFFSWPDVMGHVMVTNHQLQ